MTAEFCTGSLCLPSSKPVKIMILCLCYIVRCYEAWGLFFMVSRGFCIQCNGLWSFFLLDNCITTAKFRTGSLCSSPSKPLLRMILFQRYILGCYKACGTLFVWVCALMSILFCFSHLEFRFVYCWLFWSPLKYIFIICSSKTNDARIKSVCTIFITKKWITETTRN